jgi:hypothetical protein
MNADLVAPEPPPKAVARLGDAYFTRPKAIAMLYGEEKRFLAKSKSAGNMDDFQGAHDQAEACAKVQNLVASYDPAKANGKLLDLGAAVEKEREAIRVDREGG